MLAGFMPRTCIALGMDRRTGRGGAGHPGKDGGMRDMARTSVFFHLLISPHHAALLPYRNLGDVSTSGYNYSFSKMQLTIDS